MIIYPMQVHTVVFVAADVRTEAVLTSVDGAVPFLIQSWNVSWIASFDQNIYYYYRLYCFECDGLLVALRKVFEVETWTVNHNHHHENRPECCLIQYFSGRRSWPIGHGRSCLNRKGVEI